MVLRARHAVAICVVALLALGIVMVTSAGLSIDAERAVTVRGILTSRTTIYAIAGVAMMLFGSVVNVERLLPRRGQPVMSWPATWLLIGSVACLLLVHVPGLGREVNGARRWMNLGPKSWNLTFQPSEIAKWTMIFVLASYAVARGRERMGEFRRGLVPGLAILVGVAGLVIVEDLGTAVLIGLVGLVILQAAGAKWWHAALLLPVPAAGVAAAIMASPYRMDRIRTFVDPYADPAGDGYHMIQSMIAVANGHLTGRGLGHGVQKFGYLPEDTTDFLFAIICEELGVAGAAVVVFLYAVLVIAGLSIMRKQTGAGARLVAMGVWLTMGLQAVINLSVVTGLAPTKGIALPLLSAGGTGWMLTAFSMGILIGMDRRAEETPRIASLIVGVENEEASPATPLTPRRHCDAEGGGRMQGVRAVSIAAPRL